MKKLIFLSPAVLILEPMIVSAASAPGSQFINFANNILRTANILVTLMFVLALLVFAYGMIRFILAAGDANGVSEAKGYILWGVIGMAVLGSIFGIIVFIRSFFGISNSPGSLQAPSIVGSTVTLPK